MRTLRTASLASSIVAVFALGRADGTPQGIQVIDLGTLGGKFGSTYPAAINDAGQVCGTSDALNGIRHAFLWTSSGGMQDLGTLQGGNYSRSEAMNANGDVVGASTFDF